MVRNRVTKTVVIIDSSAPKFGCYYFVASEIVLTVNCDISMGAENILAFQMT